MAIENKTFRIFISSTFSDLREERNALQKEVFPKLKHLCMQHGFRFQAIDLRWGIRDESSLDQQTMNICLEEVARCQRPPHPNFIVLLGNRYGWQPLPAVIPEVEFEQITTKTSVQEENALLKKWYRRDDNSIPPVYCLQPRKLNLDPNSSELEQIAVRELEKQQWIETENKIRSILRRAVDELSFDEDQRIKYFSSATEQEIVAGALNAPDVSQHVFAYCREIDGLPIDKNSKDFIDLEPGSDKPRVDEYARGKLEKLKTKLKNKLDPGNCFEYETEWQEKGLGTHHLKTLCDDVYSSLSAIILKEINQLEEQAPLEREITIHEDFARERAEVFLGREKILSEIRNYIENSNRKPLAIHGESGTGKSALLARSIQVNKEVFEKANFIYRFIGASPESSDIRTLLESLCHQISSIYDTEEKEIPSGYRELTEEFPKQLAKASTENPLVLYLDALDQLSEADNGKNLVWLPEELPENVSLIISTIQNDRLQVLKTKLSANNILELDVLPPKEGKDLLEEWLSKTGRTLQESQQRKILEQFSKPGNGKPLYLRIAFEEAKRWKSYTEDITLSPDIRGMIRDLYRRLALEENHGEMLVSRSLGYLAAARKGLTEDELVDVLSDDGEVYTALMKNPYHDPPERKLPFVFWSRLYFDLEAYLAERAADGTSLLGFYHRQFREVAEEIYLPGEDRHRGLADYFGKEALYLDGDEMKAPNLRKLSELPFQQTRGALWDELTDGLCNLDFIQAKCSAGMTYELVNDYIFALGSIPDNAPWIEKENERQVLLNKFSTDLVLFSQGDLDRLEVPQSIIPWNNQKIDTAIEFIKTNANRADRLKEFYNFLGNEAPKLQKHAKEIPHLVTQQAWNYSNEGFVSQSAKQMPNEILNRLLLRKVHYESSVSFFPQAIKTLKSDADQILALAATPNGKLGIFASSTKKRNNEFTCDLWDLENGISLRKLRGHTDLVEALAITPDGKLALSGSDDKTCILWDLVNGKPLKILSGYMDKVYAVAMTPNGKQAITGSKDTNCVLWDLESGKAIKILRGHRNSVTALSISPDGKLALSGSFDRTCILWDLNSGLPRKILKGHSDFVQSVAMTPDGGIGFSGSKDRTCIIWDLRRGVPRKTLRIHSDNVNSVALTPDGKIGFSGSFDLNCILWNLQGGLPMKAFSGHGNIISAVAITADGRIGISGSWDRSCILWDLEKGKHRSPRIKPDAVLAVASLKNGNIGISGSHGGTILIRDLQTGSPIKSFKAQDGPINAVAITPDGKRMLSGSENGTCFFWDLESDNPIKKFKSQNGPVKTLALSADGRMVISGTADGTCVFWDLEKIKRVKILKGHQHSVISAAISPDGKMALSGSPDHTCILWDLNKGRIHNILKGHTNAVTSLAFSPDGKMALSGSYDHSCILWDLKKGTPLKILSGHSNYVQAVAFSPDGNTAISCSFDLLCNLWELASGKIIARFYSKSDITSIALIPQGYFASMRLGEPVILQAHKDLICPGTALVTIIKIWNFEVGKYNSLSTDCPLCGHRFPPPQDVMNTIIEIARKTGLRPDQSPCLELPDMSWEDPRLLSECPHCQKPLRFNPFIVDNAAQQDLKQTPGIEPGKEVPKKPEAASKHDQPTESSYTEKLDAARKWLKEKKLDKIGQPKKIEDTQASKIDVEKVAKALLEQGNRSFNKGDYEVAIHFYSKALARKNNQYPDAYNCLGKVYHKTEEIEKAVVFFNRAIKLDPDFLEAYMNLGKAYVELKDYEGAIQTFKKSLRIKKDDPYIYIELGLVYRKLNDLDRAIEYYKSAIRCKPDYGFAYFMLGGAYLSKDMKNEAIEAYKQAIEIDDNDKFFHFNLGQAYKSTGSTAEAKYHFKRSMELGYGSAKVALESLNKPISPPKPSQKIPQEITLLHTLSGHTDPVNSVAMSPSSSYLVSAAGNKFKTLDGSTDYILKIWDLETGKCRQTLSGHTQPVTGCTVSRDGKRVISIGEDALISWDPYTGDMVNRYDLPGFAISKCTDHNDIVAVSFIISYLNLSSGKEHFSHLSDDMIHACAISKNGHFIFTAGSDEHLKVWTNTGAELGFLKPRKEGESNEKIVHDFYACSISPNDIFLGSGGTDNKLRIWDAFTLEERFCLEGHNDHISACAFDPSGSMIASTDFSGKILIWEVKTGRLLHSLFGHERSANDCKFSLCGKFLITCGDDKLVKVWALTK